MKTILLIEDNDIMRENTIELLELSNYKVVSTDNGINGLQLIAESNPDLIICDINLPGLSGIEVYKRFLDRHDAGKVPFIFLSASSQALENDAGIKPDAFVGKPYSAEDLLSAIEGCFSHVTAHK